MAGRFERLWNCCWIVSWSGYLDLVLTFFLNFREAGPLMVSPTGQFIAPATIPGFMLVDFITCNLEEAKEKARLYIRYVLFCCLWIDSLIPVLYSNKIIEEQLFSKCIQHFNLKNLSKDDSVTPDKMIKSLGNLLQQAHSNENLQNIHLNITNYYSILTDGTVCIPWDFQIDKQ